MESALLALPPQRAARKYFGAFSACFLTAVPAVFLLLILGGLAASAYAATGRDGDRKRDSSQSGPRLKSDLRGEIPTSDGRRIHLVLDLGNIVIHTQNSGKIDYTVHLEADSSQKDAKELLKSFSVSAHETPEGVYLRG